MDATINTYGLRPEFLIPIAARDEPSLYKLGLPQTIKLRPDKSVVAAAVKPLSARFAHFSRGASLIPAGADISTERYRELVEEEQLWIRPEEKAYGAVYKNWQYPKPIPAGYDVDHALSKELALHLGYAYVRLTLVAIRPNRSAGSSGEKLALRHGPSASELCRQTRDPILYADPSDLCKLFNVAQRNTVLDGVADFQRKNPFIFR